MESNKEYIQKTIAILIKVGFSKRKIADLYGVDRSHLYKWLRGELNPVEYYKIVSQRLIDVVTNTLNLSKAEQMLTITQSIESYKKSPAGVQRRLAIKSRLTDDEKYAKSRAEVLQEEPWCHLCGTTSGRLDTHHIVYRSEAPGHKYLHHKRNLIVLCRTCHELLHSNKIARDLLIQERKLHLFFTHLNA